MGLIERNYLISQLAPPLDQQLTTQLIDEFISMEQRFIQRDWEPAELDGGHFVEVLSLIIYQIDSGNTNSNKRVEDYLSYVEDKDSKFQHNFGVRRDALHLTKVLRTIYNFRNQRGVAHISPTYSPNHMDAKLVIECVRWCMNETLRIFWNGDREKVAKAIRELLQFDVPSIGVFEDIILVQRTDLKPEEEILLLLHFAGENGFTRTELGKHSKSPASTVTRSIQKLIAVDCRQVIELSGKRYRLTDLGAKRIRENLADKLIQ